MSTSGVSTTAYAVTTQDFKTSSVESRRASDDIIDSISRWEGYRAGAYTDELSYSKVQTIGYGYTFYSGAIIYNNITKTEAWSQLVNAINGSYTNDVNRYINNYKIKTNQQQFDAMISFSYNIGSGYWNSSGSVSYTHLIYCVTRTLRHSVAQPA